MNTKAQNLEVPCVPVTPESLFLTVRPTRRVFSVSKAYQRRHQLWISLADRFWLQNSVCLLVRQTASLLFSYSLPPKSDASWPNIGSEPCKEDSKRGPKPYRKYPVYSLSHNHNVYSVLHLVPSVKCNLEAA